MFVVFSNLDGSTNGNDIDVNYHAYHSLLRRPFLPWKDAKEVAKKDDYLLEVSLIECFILHAFTCAFDA